MISKKLLTLGLSVGTALLLSACGDDSSGGTEVPIVPPTSSAVGPTPTSSATTPVPTTQTYGTLPSTANPTAAMTLYAQWKAQYYRTYLQEAQLYPVLAMDWNIVFAPYTAAGLYPGRVVWDTNSDYYCVIDEATDSYKKRGCTVSEGVGYGMLLALFAGDWDTFNGLWTYNRGFRAYKAVNDLMPWRVGTYSFEALGSNANNNSATDADLDIAASLVLAYYQTGSVDYLVDAQKIITSIWNYEISPTNLIYSGDSPSWKTATAAYNLSYFSPVALRLFALADQAHDWTGVLNAMYTYMIGVQSKGTGVFPDWSDEAGNPIDPKNGSATKTYWRFHHEAVRIPWRIAWDYYWTQDPRALQVLTTLNTFISAKTGGDPSQLEATAGKYMYSAVTTMPDSLLKTPNLLPQWHGAWCLTGMGTNQAWLDNCTTQYNAGRVINTFSYFPHILMTMYSELLNGLFVKPATLPF